MGGETGEPVAVRVDELSIDGVSLEQSPVDPLEQGEVGADRHGQVEVGERRPPSGQTADPLRVAEGEQTGLGQRVDGDDGGAVALGLLERAEHARVVGAGVLAGDDDQLGSLEVVEGDRALADADRLAERDAARLVAHVRAVRQVVGAERADEQLVEEGCLVARAARRVEDRPIGGRQRPQTIADEADGGFPADRPIVRVTGRPIDRLGEAALLAEPVVGAAGELGDRVGGEEVGGDPAVGGLLGDGLRSVLAELETRRVVRFRPGAPRAVETRRLVDVQHRARRLGRAHLGAQCAHGGDDTRHPRCPSLRGGDAKLVVADVVTRRPAGHGAQPTVATHGGRREPWALPLRLCQHHTVRETGAQTMKSRVTLLVAGGAALVAGAIAPSMLAGAVTAAEPTTTTTEAATTEPAFVLPAGYRYLVDDTNRITVAVPETWTDIATFPGNIGGASVPAINAATDLQLWNDTFDAPGVLYAAFPYTSDPQTLINVYGLTAGCASSTVVPYADGVFTGSWAQWTECGPGGAAEWHLIVASPADQAFTAFVQIQLTGPQDQQAFDVVLETFNVDAGGDVARLAHHDADQRAHDDRPPRRRPPRPHRPPRRRRPRSHRRRRRPRRARRCSFQRRRRPTSGRPRRRRPCRRPQLADGRDTAGRRDRLPHRHRPGELDRSEPRLRSS